MGDTFTHIPYTYAILGERQVPLHPVEEEDEIFWRTASPGQHSCYTARGGPPGWAGRVGVDGRFGNNSIPKT